MDPCQRCGQHVPFQDGTTVLYGEIHALLCVTCRNDWHQYFLVLPEYAEVQALKAQELWLHGRAAAMEAPTQEEWQQYVTAYHAVKEQVGLRALTWLTHPVPAVASTEGP